MHSITLPIHSFVDLITNSSSETYVTATKKSVSSVKDILKFFLEKNGITTPVDELFDVKLVYTGYNNETGKEEDQEGESEYQPSRVTITVKDKSPENKKLAKLLDSFASSFTAVEYMN